MDNKELVAALRTSYMVCGITMRARGGPNEGISATVVKEIKNAQMNVRNVMYEATMSFGEDRLLKNTDLMPMLTKMHEAQGPFNALVQALPEKLRPLFALVPRYRPVDAPDGFGTMDEKTFNQLGAHVEGRIARDFEIGQSDIIDRLRVALTFFISRVEAFDQYMAAPDRKTKVVMRDSVLGNVVDALRIVDASNISRGPRLLRFAELLAPVTSMTMDNIRTDENMRQSAIMAAHAANNDVATWLMGDPTPLNTSGASASNNNETTAG